MLKLRKQIKNNREETKTVFCLTQKEKNTQSNAHKKQDPKKDHPTV